MTETIYFFNHKWCNKRISPFPCKRYMSKCYGRTTWTEWSSPFHSITTLSSLCCYVDLRYNKGMSRHECWSSALDESTGSIWMDFIYPFSHASSHSKLSEERHYHLVEGSLLLGWNLAWLVLSTVASYRSPVIHPEIEIWKSIIHKGRLSDAPVWTRGFFGVTLMQYLFYFPEYQVGSS